MIPLGYTMPAASVSNKIGFIKEKYKPAGNKLITDDSESHLLTIAPTGAGKGRSNIIPACLTYPGSLVVIDVKGEAARVTANVRKKFGDVILIDPFKVVTKNPHRFNPMDIAIHKDAYDQAGTMLATAFQGDNTTISNDPYWDHKAIELISAITINELGAKKDFANVRKALFNDDVDYELAKLMDSKTITSTFAYELLAAYLQIPSDKTRPCILSTAQQYVALLGDPVVLDSLRGPSGFNVQDLIDGKPMTIYFIIPINKLDAYNSLLKLWVRSILFLLSERKRKPQSKTLMILDECSNLGTMKPLVSSITLMRSFGLRIWCFFQSLSQIKERYPKEWQTIVDNSNIIEVFGINKYYSSKEIADLLGNITPHQILNMPGSEAILLMNDHRIQRVQKLDYLKDKRYRDLGYDSNPFYSNEK
ncbi:MAG TPA: type IV secretory system conjugative DNA transfer family protein [Parafilimonas sp.]|nr:type IV secretory system conjugative DNA transfer family protein [Parafilimonas sp.]